jgi:flagellar motility protein MotE (MotC chaperone)
MKLLRHPIVIAVVALCSGLGTGLFVYWRAATKIATALAEAKAEGKGIHPEKGWDFWTIEIDNLTSELKGEKEKIRAEYALLEQRTVQLAAERQELEKLRAVLEKMRQEITGRVTEISADEMKNLRTLSQTYSVITPKAAVAIMREMDDATVVKILSLMKPDVVSPIFDEMSHTADASGSLAKRAATLSERLRLVKAAKSPAP